jgi:hypothetical protein
MRCSACDASIELAPSERVAFRATCSDCGADLHVCKSCRFHDPGAQNECRESSSEWVSDRERANHCEYFAPSDVGGGEAAKAADAAKSVLEDLFKK